MRIHPPFGTAVKDWYFANIQGVSNSGLTKTKNWLAGKDAPVASSDFFRLGNMVDAHLLQKSEWDTSATHEEKIHAIRLSGLLTTNPLCASILAAGEYQAVFVNQIQIELEGIEKVVDSRCMVDVAVSRMRLGCDIKTGSFSSLSGFLGSIERFDYDRAAYWYMETGEFDTFVIIGIGKKGHGPFVHIVRRGDSMFLSGKEKAHPLAYYYELAI